MKFKGFQSFNHQLFIFKNDKRCDLASLCCFHRIKMLDGGIVVALNHCIDIRYNKDLTHGPLWTYSSFLSFIAFDLVLQVTQGVTSVRFWWKLKDASEEQEGNYHQGGKLMFLLLPESESSSFTSQLPHSPPIVRSL